MTNVLGRWFTKYFSDPEGVILAILLLLGFAVVIGFGDMLAPVLASVVIAYLFEAIIIILEARNIARMPAVIFVFSIFITLLLLVIFVLVPLLSKQLAQLVQEIPNMASEGQKSLMRLPELYPQFISENQVSEIMAAIRSGLTSFGQEVLSFSLASISTLFTILVYLVLLPVLVFFFMKDKKQIIDWILSYIPRERGVATRVWQEMDSQIGNYVRGKFIEILIVGSVSYLVFSLMGLNYASLLGALVGLSVVVPYIGAVVVTAPVLLIGYFQWGWSDDFAYLALIYLVIQGLDGNVLVPWLFSEAVNLHPVAIIIAILLFGGIWGFWGVFFAIPLATLVKAVIGAWPRVSETMVDADSPE